MEGGRKSTATRGVEAIAAIAKKRAEKSGMDIFSGEDGLAEVAKPDGQWNWALIGPDPVHMPLCGGGRGGVEEMKDTILHNKHAHAFGLLRLHFGLAHEAKTKFLFIHASDPIDSGNFTQVQRGKAMAVGSKMEALISSMATYTAKIKLESPDECTVENVIGKMQEVVKGMGSEGINVEAYKAAWTREAQINEAVIKEQDKRKEEAQKMLEEAAAVKTKAASAAQAELEVAPLEEEQKLEEAPKQRKRIKLFAIGDQVEVWSSKNDMWYLDAEVVDVAAETGAVDGLKIKAGSMKVVYDNGSRFKWVPPQQMEGYLRLSPRPKPPAPLTGNISHATNGWFSTQWTVSYAELNRGFLQWWETQDHAQQGALPLGKMHLRGLQQKETGLTIQLRSDSTGASIYNFQLDTPEMVSLWVTQMWAHAGFCEEWAEFTKAKQGGDDMRKQLLTKMLKKAEENA